MTQAPAPPCPCACTYTPPRTTVRFDRASLLVTGRSSLRVRRPLMELAAVLDPQRWDETVPRLIGRAWVVDPGSPVEPGKDFEVAPAADAPLPGSAWRRVLFENYSLDVAGWKGAVSFKTLLDVASEPRAGGHRFTYTLRRILHSRLGPLQMVGGGLDRDDGYVDLVELGGGWVELRAEKILRLAGWSAFGVPLDALLNLMTRLTAGGTIGSAYDAVCMEA